jgi:folate-binding Fe-S cluster repair protein YgfZ
MTEPNDRTLYVALEDRGAIALTGEDTIDFFQGLVSNDVTLVAPDRSIYATLLTPQGKFLFDFIVSAWPGGVLLDVEAARRADLIKRLTMYKLRAKVDIADLTGTHAVFAAFGGAEAAALALPAQAGSARPLDDGVALVDPRMAALGVRIVAPADAATTLLEGAGFTSGAAADFERHRLSLGVPDGGRDIQVD